MSLYRVFLNTIFFHLDIIVVAAHFSVHLSGTQGCDNHSKKQSMLTDPSRKRDVLPVRHRDWDGRGKKEGPLKEIVGTVYCSMQYVLV